VLAHTVREVAPESGVVVLTEEDSPPAHAAPDDVVQASGDDAARESGHDVDPGPRRIAGQGPNSSKKRWLSHER
jgi:hypothetical protein